MPKTVGARRRQPGHILGALRAVSLGGEAHGGKVYLYSGGLADYLLPNPKKLATEDRKPPEDPDFPVVVGVFELPLITFRAPRDVAV